MSCIPLDHRGAGLLIRLYDFPQLLRIKLFRERGRAHQVTEQHRQLAALRFGWSPLGQLWCRRSRVSGGVAWLRNRRQGRWGSEPRATVTTEFRGGPDLAAAARTGSHERGATLLAELGSPFILK